MLFPIFPFFFKSFRPEVERTLRLLPQNIINHDKLFFAINKATRVHRAVKRRNCLFVCLFVCFVVFLCKQQLILIMFTNDKLFITVEMHVN